MVCNFYLSVAARKIVEIRSVREIHSHVAGTLSSKQTNKPLFPPHCTQSTPELDRLEITVLLGWAWNTDNSITLELRVQSVYLAASV